MRTVFDYIVFLLVVLFAACCSSKEPKGYECDRPKEPKDYNSIMKPGYEYLSDSVYEGEFHFFEKSDEINNYKLLSEQMRKNFDNRKYQNHFLYCLDTISDYHTFVCHSAEFFETLCPIAWGFLYPDCELEAKESVSTEEFEIIKFNNIHGASLIVNSCLFYTYIPYGEDHVKYEDDEFFLVKKYYYPYWNKEKLSDSLMMQMLSDIDKLCAKYKNKKWFTLNVTK